MAAVPCLLASQEGPLDGPMLARDSGTVKHTPRPRPTAPSRTLSWLSEST